MAGRMCPLSNAKLREVGVTGGRATVDWFIHLSGLARFNQTHETELINKIGQPVHRASEQPLDSAANRIDHSHRQTMRARHKETANKNTKEVQHDTRTMGSVS